MEKCTLKIEVENTITNERDELVSMQITPETYRAIRKLIAERMLATIAKEDERANPNGASVAFGANAAPAHIGICTESNIHPELVGAAAFYKASPHVALYENGRFIRLIPSVSGANKMIFLRDSELGDKDFMRTKKIHTDEYGFIFPIYEAKSKRGSVKVKLQKKHKTSK